MTAVTHAPEATTPQERASLRLLGNAVVMAIVLGLMLLGGYHLVLRHLRHSPEAKVANQLLEHSTQLRRIVGDPLAFRLEAGEVASDGMKATFSYTVEGPHGDAAVDVELAKQGPGWRLASGTVETDDGVMPFDAR